MNSTIRLLGLEFTYLGLEFNYLPTEFRISDDSFHQNNGAGSKNTLQKKKLYATI